MQQFFDLPSWEKNNWIKHNVDFQAISDGKMTNREYKDSSSEIITSTISLLCLLSFIYSTKCFKIFLVITCLSASLSKNSEQSISAKTPLCALCISGMTYLWRWISIQTLETPWNKWSLCSFSAIHSSLTVLFSYRCQEHWSDLLSCSVFAGQTYALQRNKLPASAGFQASRIWYSSVSSLSPAELVQQLHWIHLEYQAAAGLANPGHY